MFLKLKYSGLGCNVELTYTDAFGYADDILVALVLPSIHGLKKLYLSVCSRLQYNF